MDKRPLSGILSPGQEKEAAKKYGFTLVELIVVITILAILGTIAFISLQGYSQDARDSVRISDISKIKTSLELFQLDAGKYPETTDAFSVTYSGAVAWTQGTFGDKTYSNVEKLDKIPTDPITNRKYIYSVTNTRQEYEVAGVMEGDEVTSILNQTNAAGKTAMLKISGNYNGKLLKVSTGGTDYVLAVPSIITSSGFTLEQIVAGKLLAYNGYKNLPAQYAGSSYEVLGDGGINFVNSSNFVVYIGSLITLSDSTQTGIDARKNLIENLQKAYSGTDINGIGEIAQIINTQLTDTSAVELLSTTIVNNDLGGSVLASGGGQTIINSCNDATKPRDNGYITFIIGTPSSINQAYMQDATNCGYTCTDGYTGFDCSIPPGKFISKTTCQSANWIWVESSNDVYIGTTQGSGFCISPRFGDWNNDSDLGNGGLSWNGWGNDANTYYQGWDASSTLIRDTGNASSSLGQTKTLNSEVTYNCKELGTASSDYIASDTIVGRMKWIANEGNSYENARNIDWISGISFPTIGITNPQPIPALYVADCIDGVKDLGNDMLYKHYPNEGANETVTYNKYKTDVTLNTYTAYLSDITYQNRQKYLTAWTQKSGSHLPSAFSYISEGTPGGCGLTACDNLLGNARGEYQVACESNLLTDSNDSEDDERIWLSAIGQTNGVGWGRGGRIIGFDSCSGQYNLLAGNHYGKISSRFVVRP